MFSNYKNKIINRLRWKYFIGEFKPMEQNNLEKTFSKLSKSDKEIVKEYKCLLDTIETNKTMRDELGINPYELFSLGSNCFINFKDPENIVVYKVHDLTNSNSLFGSAKKSSTAEQVKKEIDKTIKNDDLYVKNFTKGYLLFALPEGVDGKSLNIGEAYKDLSFKNVTFDDKNKVLIIEAN